MSIKLSIGLEIRQIRAKLGFTQDQLARHFNKLSPKHIKTSRSDISKYERDLIDPPASKYRKFQTLID